MRPLTEEGSEKTFPKLMKITKDAINKYVGEITRKEKKVNPARSKKYAEAWYEKLPPQSSPCIPSDHVDREREPPSTSQRAIDRDCWNLKSLNEMAPTKADHTQHSLTFYSAYNIQAPWRQWSNYPFLGTAEVLTSDKLLECEWVSPITWPDYDIKVQKEQYKTHHDNTCSECGCDLLFARVGMGKDGFCVECGLAMPGKCRECGSELRYIHDVGTDHEGGKFCTNPMCGLVEEKPIVGSRTIGIQDEYCKGKRKDIHPSGSWEEIELCCQSYLSVPYIANPIPIEEMIWSKEESVIDLLSEYTNPELAAWFKKIGGKPSTATTIKKTRDQLTEPMPLKSVVFDECSDYVSDYVKRSNSINVLSSGSIDKSAIPPYAYVMYKGTRIGALLEKTKMSGTGREALYSLWVYSMALAHPESEDTLLPPEPTRENIIKFFHGIIFGRSEPMSERIAEERFDLLVEEKIIEKVGNLYRFAESDIYYTGPDSPYWGMDIVF